MSNSPIENTITKKNLIFAEFKAFQDLSYYEVCNLFGCTLQESMAWARGDAPEEIDRIALIANKVAEKARLRGMSDTDKQYFEKQKENLLCKLALSNRIVFKLNTSIENHLCMSLTERLIFLFNPRKIRDRYVPVEDIYLNNIQP